MWKKENKIPRLGRFISKLLIHSWVLYIIFKNNSSSDQCSGRKYLGFLYVLWGFILLSTQIVNPNSLYTITLLFCFPKIVCNWLDFNQMDPKKVKTYKPIFFVFVYLETIYRKTQCYHICFHYAKYQNIHTVILV